MSKERQTFERDARLEAMLAEQRETPRRYEWLHSLNEKREAERYAEAKRKAEVKQ